MVTEGQVPHDSLAERAGIIWRRWRPLLVAGVIVEGSGGLTIVLKEVLGRSRPPLNEALAATYGYAFPSAHAATASAELGYSQAITRARLSRPALC